jgi:hypothetical protein
MGSQDIPEHELHRYAKGPEYTAESAASDYSPWSPPTYRILGMISPDPDVTYHIVAGLVPVRGLEGVKVKVTYPTISGRID